VRDIEVYKAELLGSGEELAGDGRCAHYEIECSTGTYVRTLIETLHDAYCSDLRRVAVGPFPNRGRGPRGADRRGRRAGPGGRRRASVRMSD